MLENSEIIYLKYTADSRGESDEFYTFATPEGAQFTITCRQDTQKELSENLERIYHYKKLNLSPDLLSIAELLESDNDRKRNEGLERALELNGKALPLLPILLTMAMFESEFTVGSSPNPTLLSQLATEVILSLKSAAKTQIEKIYLSIDSTLKNQNKLKEILLGFGSEIVLEEIRNELSSAENVAKLASAIENLGKVGNADLIVELKKYLTHDNWNVRTAAEAAVKKIITMRSR